MTRHPPGGRDRFLAAERVREEKSLRHELWPRSRAVAALSSRFIVAVRVVAGLGILWGAGAAGAASEWHSAPGCRWAELPVPAEGKTGFTLLAAEATGIDFTNRLAETTSALNRILENGSGVALGDMDGDGWCDVYFCRLEGDNVLYRNLGGWRFTNVTDNAGVACSNQYSTGAVFADVDGDGDLDLLVNAIGGGTRSFLNDGHGRFEEVKDGRLVRRFGSTSLALADIDNDTDLDLYVANYRVNTYQDRPPGLEVEARMVDGRIVVTPEDRFIPLMSREGGVEVMEKGERDFLYLNDGRGRFAPVSWTSGAFLDEDGRPLGAPPTDWGLSVMFRDLNRDGFPDLYVCNDFFFFPDRIWLSEGGRNFRALDRYALRHQCVSSMGMDVADIDRDGHDDLFVTDMLSRNHAWRQRQRPNMMKGLIQQAIHDPAFRPEVAHNTLALNRGDGSYAEIAQLSGVDFTEWSWGAVFLDVDLDGYEDLIIPTGNNHDVQDADTLRAQSRLQQSDSLENRLANWRKFPALATPVLGYRNQHDLTFTEQTAAWGFGAPGPWQGLALADLDRDGDLDLAINRLNDVAGLYRNDGTTPRLAVRLKGAGLNSRGIGARITVEGGPVTQTQEMICGGRYLSGDEAVRVFAAGAATNRLRLEVRWRSGKRSVVEEARPNRLYEIDETGASATPVPEVSRTSTPFFEDVSERLGHAHREAPGDDFDRQPLLSRRLSTGGPGIGWFDLDADGWDDLIVGGGRGGGRAVFHNDGRGGFSAVTNLVSTTARAEGEAGFMGYRLSPSNAVLFSAITAAPGASASTGAVEMARVGESKVGSRVPGLIGEVGALALGDIDGDGDLDWFAGGRARTGRYPEASPSHLLRNGTGADGRLEFGPMDAETQQSLADVGLVNSAVFTDLTGDGFPELVLACEWGPIRLFRNHQGRLSAWNAPLAWPSSIPAQRAPRPESFERLTGWWNSVNSGDFDGDGQLDLVVAGWGRNTRFQRFLDQPLRLYWGDLGAAGGVDLIEAVFDAALKKWVPWRDYDTMVKALPFLAEAVPTFRSYGEAGVEELFGDRLRAMRLAEAATLDSLVLLNRRDRFEARPLPLAAQFAPAFGVAVGDYDGDGAEDLFLSQNFFGVEPETSRYDAGVGLWLQGDGRGGFRPVPASESGVRIPGEQRGCALADFDGDGRVDLAVAQHNGPTRLYRNTRGAAGVRVRLEGPPGNPEGIGAVLRLKQRDRWGPAREVHAGSGWWSQDSAVQVLAAPRSPAQLEVRWPGGKILTVEVPIAREIEVTASGDVRAPK